MRQIRRELGDQTEDDDPVAELRERIEDLDLPEEAQAEALKQLRRLEHLNPWIQVLETAELLKRFSLSLFGEIQVLNAFTQFGDGVVVFGLIPQLPPDLSHLFP